jgi:hypothetical protein
VLCQLSYWPKSKLPASRFLLLDSKLATTAGSWELEAGSYFVSLCATCLRQNRQNLLSSSRSLVFFLFFVVL